MMLTIMDDGGNVVRWWCIQQSKIYDVYNNGMMKAMWYDGGVYNSGAILGSIRKSDHFSQREVVRDPIRYPNIAF